MIADSASLLAYGKEGQNWPSDQLKRRVTFKFMAEMEVDPMDYMAPFRSILKVLSNLLLDSLMRNKSSLNLYKI